MTMSSIRRLGRAAGSALIVKLSLKSILNAVTLGELSALRTYAVSPRSATLTGFMPSEGLAYEL